jgi:TPP-dependent 2-oxoacid decarboxylase
MGRVNNTFAYDQKKVRKYGKLYGSIDFEVSDTISAHYFENNEKPVIGKLLIGGKSFDVTYQELDQIARTMNAAKDVVNRKHKLGMMR